MITADPANSPLIDEIVGVDMLIGASPWPTQAPHDLVALPNIAR
jgi:hypothetical protein